MGLVRLAAPMGRRRCKPPRRWHRPLTPRPAPTGGGTRIDLPGACARLAARGVPASTSSSPSTTRRTISRAVSTSVLAHTDAPHRLCPDRRRVAGPGDRRLFAANSPGARCRSSRSLRNERNLGFTGTANRGMAFSRADVVLLNSDTVVTAGWLDALARCAASDPAHRHHHAVLEQRGDLLVSALLRGQRLAGERGPGARARRARACRGADLSGSADRRRFLSLRAARADRCDRRVRSRVRPRLRRGERFLPARRGRRLSQRALRRRVRAAPRRPLVRGEEGGARRAQSRHPAGALSALHGVDPRLHRRRSAAAAARRGRGAAARGHRAGARRAARHPRARRRHRAPRARADRRVARANAATISRSPSATPGRSRNTSTTATCARSIFARRADEAWPDFVGGICATFRIGLLHLHNISGCRDGIVAALAALGLPYGYTVHDLNFACPTILFLGADGNYCHEQTDPAVCSACLAGAAGVRAHRHRRLARAARRAARAAPRS